MSSPDPLQFDFYKQQLEHREGLRRDIELHVEPLVNQALDADKAAIQLGQSILKTGTLLNGVNPTFVSPGAISKLTHWLWPGLFGIGCSGMAENYSFWPCPKGA